MMRRFRQFPTIGGRRGGIPADCVEVEYIWVNGNQYLDTGLTFSNAIEMFLKCKIENGRCGLISTTNHRYYAGVVSGKVAVGYNATYNHAVCSVDDSIHTYGCTTSGFTIDGVTAVSYSLNAAEDNTTYYIGALNYKNTTVQYSVKGYIYSAKFVKSGTTILDLVPVRRVESGVSVGYMCDRLTGALYGNAGTGAFVIGPDAGLPYDAEIEYLRSTGTQYIDTGIVATQTTGAYWKVKCNTYNDGCLGMYQSSIDMLYIDFYGNGIYFRYGKYASSKITSGFDASGVNEMECKDGSCYLNGESVYDGANTSSIGSDSRTLYIFARNHRGSAAGYALVDLYAHKIYDGSDLVADFVPVRVGTVGYLYDRVSGELFGNDGTGAFTLGPDK